MLGGHNLAVGSCRAPSVASDRVMAADRWPAIVAGLRSEVVNSALGTTIAKAGSRQAIAAIDHDTNVAVAPAAKTTGARQFLMVSSAPARSRSTNFYIATKRQAEMFVTALGSERLYQKLEIMTLVGLPSLSCADSRWQTTGVCHGYSHSDGF